MVIVEISQIPQLDSIADVPLDNIIKVFKTCQELQMLCESENGIGISAVQVGIPWKLFLIKGDGTCPLVPKGQYGYFANCKYEPIGQDQVVSLEGCLSIKNAEGRLRSFEVQRYKNIRLTGSQIKIGRKVDIEKIDANLSLMEEGIVFQHEIDHHSSILISDIGKAVFVW